jgi:bacterioferritin-associated ferredoxin
MAVDGLAIANQNQGRSEQGAFAVIVCSCNVLTDHQVRSVVTTERAARGTSEVYRCLGCSAECGRCARTIRRIMDEAIRTCPVEGGCGHR